MSNEEYIAVKNVERAFYEWKMLKEAGCFRQAKAAKKAYVEAKKAHVKLMIKLGEIEKEGENDV